MIASTPASSSLQNASGSFARPGKAAADADDGDRFAVARAVAPRARAVHRHRCRDTLPCPADSCTLRHSLPDSVPIRDADMPSATGPRGSERGTASSRGRPLGFFGESRHLRITGSETRRVGASFAMVSIRSRRRSAAAGGLRRRGQSGLLAYAEAVGRGMRTCPIRLMIIWRERRRYLPAVLAVAFSDLLITVQVGLLLGALSVLSLPIDHSAADVWVASPEVLSLELGYPIPESWRSRLASMPEVVDTEPYLYGFSYWRKPQGGSEVCCVIGSRLERGALGVVSDLTPRMRTLLTEPGAVVVDETELERLGVSGVGGVAEVAGRRVRVVGLVRGLKSVGPPYVFCSLRTAYLLQPLFRDYPGHTMYLLGRCRDPADAPAVARAAEQARSDLSAFTREEFSTRTQIYWATQHQGRHRHGLHGLAQPARRPGGHQPDAVRGHGRVAARVRRAPRAGHPALAHGRHGDGPVVLGRPGGDRPGPADDLRPGGRRRRRRRPRAAAPLAVRPRLGPDPGDGPVCPAWPPCGRCAWSSRSPCCAESDRSMRMPAPSRPWSPATWTARSAPARRPSRVLRDVSLELHPGQVLLC